MVFPGIGRQSWVSGSLGGGTGRTADWDTYDGTEDTDWQQWIDETSTALPVDYSIVSQDQRIAKIGNERALLIIDTADNNSTIGLVRTDAVDPTSAQIETFHTLNETAGMIYKPPYVVTHSTEQNGSIRINSLENDAITLAPRISDLFLFYSKDSTYQPNKNRSWLQIKQGAETKSFKTISGDNYAGDTRDYLQFGTESPEPFGENLDHLIIQAHSNYYINDTLSDLYSAPSTGLESIPGANFIDRQMSQNDAKYAWKTFASTSEIGGSLGTTTDINGTVILDYKGGAKACDFLRMRGTPQFTTTTIKQYNLSWSVAATRGVRSSSDLNVSFAGDRTIEWHWRQRLAVIVENEFEADGSRDYTDQTSALGGATDVEKGFIAVQVKLNDTRDIEDIYKHHQAIEVGEKMFVGMFADAHSDTGVGNLRLTTAQVTDDTNFNGNPYSVDNSDVGAYFDRTDSSFTAGINPGLPLLQNSVVDVSILNGSNSTSTANDPDESFMFNLQGNYFAVVWRKATDIYISIFEATPGSSTYPTLTRHVDAQSLGTLNLDSGNPGRLAGTSLGTGVALITCGNYYKFIKVPV